MPHTHRIGLIYGVSGIVQEIPSGNTIVVTDIKWLVNRLDSNNIIGSLKAMLDSIGLPRVLALILSKHVLEKIGRGCESGVIPVWGL